MKQDDRPPATRWELGFETLTPTFLGGALPNERKEAELRVPSIRGALRAWYRLLVGPEIAARGFGPERRFRESSLFGGTASGEGQGRQVLSLAEPPPVGSQPWDPRAQGRDGPGSGRAYLGYTLKMGSNDRHALPPGTEFRVRAVHPRGLPEDEAQLLLSAWWLFANLGGLGTRSRRGFGSLTAKWPPDVTSYDGSAPPRLRPKLPAVSEAASYGALLEALGLGLSRIWNRRLALVGDPGELPDGPAYRLDEGSRFVIWGPGGERGWTRASEALDAVGRNLAQFRRQPGVDGLEEPALTTLKAGRRLSSAPARAAFGLPLAYRDKQSRQSFELRPYDEETEAARMASPLLIHITGTQAGYFAVFTRVSGRLPGQDVPLVQKGQRGHVPANPGARALDAFLDQLPGKKEVKL